MMSASEARLARLKLRTKVFGLLVCIACAAGGDARADAPPALDVVVRIADPEDQLLLERVRGQTNDLDVELTPDASGPLEPTLSGQLERARDLDRAHTARVVVWFVHDARSLTVFVSEPAAGRVLVRRLDSPEGQHASSAQHEAAALVVRTAMRALAEGGEIGVIENQVSETAADEPPPAAPPIPTSAPASAPSDAAQAPDAARSPQRPSRWELLQFLGARAAWDGVGARGQYGLSGRLALRVGAFQVELRGSFGFAERLDDQVARVRMARHSVGAHVGVVPLIRDIWIVSAAIGAGANLFVTDVEARANGLSARDDLLTSAALSGDVTVRVMPAWALRRVGFAFLAGMDVLPRAPVLGYYDDRGRFVRRDRAWNALPTIALDLVVRLD